MHLVKGMCYLIIIVDGIDDDGFDNDVYDDFDDDVDDDDDGDVDDYYDENNN